MDVVAFAANIGAALLMGTVIGLERQIRLHTAGLRTNSLVCLGAALFVSLSRLIDHEGSPTRIAAQVVSSIGFLGGGVIFRTDRVLHQSKCSSSLPEPGRPPKPGERRIQALVCQLSTGGFSGWNSGSTNRKWSARALTKGS